MAYSRRLGCEDGTVLCACSICGNAFRFPTELRYCSDGLFRCMRFCAETETPRDEQLKQTQRRPGDETALPFPVGVKPSWYT